MKKLKFSILKWGPRSLAYSYAGYVLSYGMELQIPPILNILLGLAGIGIAYGLKDYYLEGDEKLMEKELDEYPWWVKTNHAKYSLDCVKVRRRILYEAKYL